jgi:hypothetical protein
MTVLTDPVFMDEYGGQDFSVSLKGKKKAKPPTNIFGFITSKVGVYEPLDVISNCSVFELGVFASCFRNITTKWAQ